MKQMMSMMIGLAIIASPIWAAQEVSTSIDHVSVYPTKAHIFRLGEVDLEKGRHSLYLPFRQSHILEDSIHVVLKGEGHVISLQTQPEFFNEDARTVVRKIEQELEELERRNRELHLLNDVLDKQEHFLDGLSNVAGDRKPGSNDWPDLGDVQKTSDFLKDHYSSLMTEQSKHRQEIDDNEEQIKLKQKQLAVLLAADKPYQGMGVYVDYEALKAGHFSVEVNYLTQAVQWQPVYELHLSEKNQKLQSVTYGSITQKTGEDWQQVGFDASTIESTFVTQRPLPSAWYLSGYQEEAMAMAESAGMRFHAAQPMMMARSDAPKVVKQEQSLFAQYQLPNRVSIPSQVARTRVFLEQATKDASMIYRTIPQQASQVYLLAKVSKDADLPQGTTHLFIDDVFVGQTFLNDKGSDPDFYVSFGTARGVSVSRTRVKDLKDEKGFAGFDRDSVRHQLGYRIQLTNTNNQPRTVQVLERLPIATTDKMAVKNMEFSMQPSEKNYQGVDGLYAWDITVAAQATLELSIGYTLVYPKDMNIDLN